MALSQLGLTLGMGWGGLRCNSEDNLRIVMIILLPAGTSIVLPVGYMDQPTGLLHIYLWRRLCGRQGRSLFLGRLCG